MKRSNLILLAVSTGFSLILLELGLRWFTVFPIHNIAENTIPDDKLIYRVDPALKDIDEQGFRNKEVLEKADIVALGDSHTYGVNVRTEDSWPQQLAGMTHKTAYNYGVGGYGSLHYYYLLDEAIQLQPQHIIVGLYLPNDLKNVCAVIRRTDFGEKWANARGYDIGPCLQSSGTISIGNARHLLRKIVRKTAIGSLIQYFGNSISAKLTLLRKKNEKAEKETTSTTPSTTTVNKTVIIDEGINRAVIEHAKTSYYVRNTDLDRPDIALGFEITKDTLKHAKEIADQNNIHLSVMFIPSKQHAFYEYLLEKQYQLPGAYHELVANERRLIDNFSSFFQESGIKYADARPYIAQELYTSGNLYPADNDHPKERGYAMYAKAIYDIVFDNP